MTRTLNKVCVKTQERESRYSAGVQETRATTGVRQVALCGSVREKDLAAKSKVSREPTLVSEGQHFSWYKTRANNLFGLTKLAMNLDNANASTEKISKSDFEYIVESLKKSGDDDKKWRKFSILALYYMARNGCRLSEEAIKQLLCVIKKEGQNNVKYALLALSYAMTQHNSLSSSDCEAFKEKISQVIAKEGNSPDFFELKIIGFKALMQAGVPLTAIGWECLRKELSMLVIGDGLSVKKSAEFSGNPSEDRTPWGYQITKLRFLRQIVEKGGLLSRKELKVVFEAFDEQHDEIVKTEVYRILRYLVANGQWKNPPENRFLKKLEAGLDQNNADIQANVLIVLGAMFNNYFDHGELKAKYLKSFSHFSSMILKMVYDAVDSMDASLLDRPSWYRLLDEIKNSSEVPENLKAMAVLTSGKIFNDAAGFAKDLTRWTITLDTCVAATTQLVNQANLTIDIDLAKNLIRLIRKPLYPEEARINAFIIFRNIIEDKPSISPDVMALMVKKLYPNVLASSLIKKDDRAHRGALFILGACLDKISSADISIEIIKHLCWAYREKGFHAASFGGLLSLVKRGDLNSEQVHELDKFFSELSGDIKPGSIFLEDGLIFFRVAAKSFYNFPKNVLPFIAKQLLADYDIKYKCAMLGIIDDAVSSLLNINNTVLLPLSDLLSAFSQAEDDLRYQIESILATHVEKLASDESVIAQLIKFLDMPELLMPTLRLIEKIAGVVPKTSNLFSAAHLDAIAKKIDIESLDESLLALSILERRSQVQCIEFHVTRLLHPLLEEEDSGLVLPVLHIFQNILERHDINNMCLSEEVWEKLVSFLGNDEFCEPSLAILTRLSDKGLRFENLFDSIWSFLSTNPSHHLIKIISEQFKYNQDDFKECELDEDGKYRLASRLSILGELIHVKDCQEAVILLLQKISGLDVCFPVELLGELVELVFSKDQYGLTDSIIKILGNQARYDVTGKVDKIFRVQQVLQSLSQAAHDHKNIVPLLRDLQRLVQEGCRVPAYSFSILAEAIRSRGLVDWAVFNLLFAITKNSQSLPPVLFDIVISYVRSEEFVFSRACSLALALCDRGEAETLSNNIFLKAEENLLEYHIDKKVKHFCGDDCSFEAGIKKLVKLLSFAASKQFIFKKETAGVLFKTLFSTWDHSLKRMIATILRSISFCQSNIVSEVLQSLPVGVLQKYMQNEKSTEILLQLSFLPGYSVEASKKDVSNQLKKENKERLALIDKIDWAVLSRDFVSKLLDCSSIEKSRYSSQLLLRVRALLKMGWCPLKLSKFLNRQIKSKERVVVDELSDLFSAFDICLSYDISDERFFLLSSGHPLGNLNACLITHEIKQRFVTSSQGQGLEKLILEIQDKNKGNALFCNLFSDQWLKNTIIASHQLCFQNGVLPSGFKSSQPINDWTNQELHLWARHIKAKRNFDLKDLIHEYLAVMKRACLIHQKAEPRPSQILVLLSMLFAPERRGRIAEVATGEGKTMIIAMLAAIKALRGERVDVMTSSSLLAERDADQYKNFYNSFGLNVASNEDRGYRGGKKACYDENVHIVYGDISAFQFDFLRDKYEKTGVRGKNYDRKNAQGERQFNAVIVDEIDNVLVDEGGRVAMLASPVAGMEQLQGLMTQIWRELEQELVRLDARGIKEVNPEIIKNLISHLEKFIVNTINSAGPNSGIFPEHLRGFALSQAVRWACSAVEAYYLVDPKVSYMIKESAEGLSLITPVDADNTGVLQKGTSWNNGLQQFLQIKHGLPITAETLTTTYVSNLGFIKKEYGGQVLGLTGTLGTENTKEFFKTALDQSVDFVHCPRFRASQARALAWVSAADEEHWFDEVVRDVERESKNKRVVLVVCENIAIAEQVELKLKEKFKNRVRHYTDSDDASNRFIESASLDAGTIIVATNLAGRGTDIKLSDNILSCGGLHTCFTYLPKNDRVYQQGIGRAGRNGAPGTSRLIVKNSEWVGLKEQVNGEALACINQDYNEIRDVIAKREEAQIEELKKNSLIQSIFKGQLFDEYIAFQAELSGKAKGESTDFDTSSEAYCKAQSDAIEERWGLWLSEVQGQMNNPVLIREKFGLFKEKIRREYEEGCVIKNPAYFVKAGNRLLSSSRFFSGKLSAVLRKKSPGHSAMALYDRAINLDPNAYIARYNKARVLLKLQKKTKQYKEECDKNKLKSDYKAQAKKELLAARESIDKELAMLRERINLAQQEVKLGQKDFQKHLQYKHVLLATFSVSIQELIRGIDRSEKLMDVCVDGEFYGDLRNEEAAKVDLGSGKVSLTFYDLLSDFDNGQVDTFLKCLKVDKKNQVSVPPVSLTATIHSVLLDSPEKKATMISLLPINCKKASSAQSNENADLSKAAVSGDLNKPAVGTDQPGEPVEDLTRSRWEWVKDKTGKAIKKIGNGVSALIAAPGKVLDAVAKRANNAMYDHEKSKALKVQLKYPGLVIQEVKKLLAEIPAGEKKVAISFHGCPGRWICEELLNNTEWQSLFSIEEVRAHQRGDFSTSSVVQHNVEGFDNKEGVFSVNFKNLSFDQAGKLSDEVSKTLLKYNKNVSNLDRPVDVSFCDLAQVEAQKIIETRGEPLEMSFVDVEYEAARSLVDLLEEHNKDTVFKFSGLSTERAQKFIKKQAKIPRQDFHVHLRKVEDSLAPSPFLGLEREVLAAQGLSTFYIAQEKKPIPWKSIAIVAALAALQFTMGLLLTALTGGAAAAFGLGLMMEPVSDVIQISSAIYRRDFSWHSYILQKSVGLIMAGGTAAIGVFGAASKAAMMSEEVVVSAASVAGQRAAGVATAVADDVVSAAKNIVTALSSLGKRALISGTTQAVTHSFSEIKGALVTSVAPSIIKSLGAILDSMMGRKSPLSKQLRKIFVAENVLAGRGIKNAEYTERLLRKVAAFFAGADDALADYFKPGNLQKFENLFFREVDSIIGEIGDVTPVFFREYLKPKRFSFSESDLNQAMAFLKSKQVLISDNQVALRKVFKEESLMFDDHKNFIQFKDQPTGIPVEEFDFTGLPSQLANLKESILEACRELAQAQHKSFYSEHQAFKERIFSHLKIRIEDKVESLASVATEVVSSATNIGVARGLEKATDCLRPSIEEINTVAPLGHHNSLESEMGMVGFSERHLKMGVGLVLDGGVAESVLPFAGESELTVGGRQKIKTFLSRLDHVLPSQRLASAVDIVETRVIVGKKIARFPGPLHFLKKTSPSIDAYVDKILISTDIIVDTSQIFIERILCDAFGSQEARDFYEFQEGMASLEKATLKDFHRFKTVVKQQIISHIVLLIVEAQVSGQTSMEVCFEVLDIVTKEGSKKHVLKIKEEVLIEKAESIFNSTIYDAHDGYKKVLELCSGSLDSKLNDLRCLFKQYHQLTNSIEEKKMDTESSNGSNNTSGSTSSRHRQGRHRSRRHRYGSGLDGGDKGKQVLISQGIDHGANLLQTGAGLIDRGLKGSQKREALKNRLDLSQEETRREKLRVGGKIAERGMGVVEKHMEVVAALDASRGQEITAVQQELGGLRSDWSKKSGDFDKRIRCLQDRFIDEKDPEKRASYKSLIDEEKTSKSTEHDKFQEKEGKLEAQIKILLADRSHPVLEQVGRFAAQMERASLTIVDVSDNQPNSAVPVPNRGVREIQSDLYRSPRAVPAITQGPAPVPVPGNGAGH